MTGDVVAARYSSLDEAMATADLMLKEMKRDGPLGGFYGSVEVLISFLYCPDPQCDVPDPVEPN